MIHNKDIGIVGSSPSLFVMLICITFLQSFDRRPVLSAALKVSPLSYCMWVWPTSSCLSLLLLQYGKMYLEAFLKSGMPVLDQLLLPKKVNQ